MIERLHWHPGSVCYEMHGPLKKAFLQVPELFFEPRRVFSMGIARKQLAAFPLADGEDDEVADADLVNTDSAVSAAVPYVADPFAELVATLMAWLQQSDG